MTGSDRLAYHRFARVTCWWFWRRQRIRLEPEIFFDNFRRGKSTGSRSSSLLCYCYSILKAFFRILSCEGEGVQDEKQKIYAEWFSVANVDGDGRVTRSDALKFFAKSNLSQPELKQIY
ncbi:uncharacterized protein A4U43_C01F26250 [Asparagus officinalis]|uniref:EF-hand domain-containing protein n=1 Tax=Asparagus officinalis TaxID=4686 RepID=A0A5P1FS93_ASPOF|nr:uncharacterized protein A4U43_C01F26250 [Asparagus officinalis]